ncbi:MAG: OmpA family protein [Fluviicola sp.]|nr:OmpA family protein [Fluviicola sp.]
MKFIIAILALFISINSFSQLKQKVADRLYDDQEYYKCVEMYNELADKALAGKKKSNWDNVEKAAESNFHIYRMKEATAYFEKLATKNKLNEHSRMHYIDGLRFAGKYGKSNEVSRESSNLFPENKFFKRLVDEQGQFNALFADSAFYRIHETCINSGKGDFAPTYFNNSIVFASKAENTGFINPRYGWDNDYYINLMQAEFGEDSVLHKVKMLKHQFISKAHDGPVSFNTAGTEMIITKNTIGKKNGKHVIVLSLYFSSLADGEWTELKPFEFNNSAYNVGHGVLSEDGSKLYFVSNQPGGFGESDIYVSEKLGTGWAEPKNLGSKINTERKEMFPFVQDEIIYFASDGHFGLGGLDIFEAKVDGSVKAHNVGYPINTSNDDFGLIFEKSGRIGFLSSNRKDNIDQIYHVVKRKLSIDLVVDVFEKYKELEPAPNQLVWIKNMTTQELDSIATDDSGKIKTSIKINNEYRIYASKDEFILLKEAAVNTNGVRKDSTYTAELVLKPTTIIIHLRVVEKATGKIIPMATTTITDYNLKKDTTIITNEEGMVTLKVDRNKVLWAHGSKKGFIDADVSFNTTNETDKIIDIELALNPIKKGQKFKLENIFYDLNKSTLREESMASLDKLSIFLLDNDLKIELSAHTDSRGSSSYNQRLSQRRAQSCVDYLKKKGVLSKNMRAKGYGEYKLVNRCKNGVKCSEEEHQENRRTEVKILEVN